MFTTYDLDKKRELALLLTQYETCGTVGEDEVKQLIIDEFLEVELNNYLYYLQEECPDDAYFDMNDFNEIMGNMTAWEVARAAFYGDFCPAHDYFRFNGYGNLESADEWKIRDEMENDKDFKEWALEETGDFDPDEWEEVIELANEMIENGY